MLGPGVVSAYNKLSSKDNLASICVPIVSTSHNPTGLHGMIRGYISTVGVDSSAVGRRLDIKHPRPKCFKSMSCSDPSALTTVKLADHGGSTSRGSLARCKLRVHKPGLQIITYEKLGTTRRFVLCNVSFIVCVALCAVFCFSVVWCFVWYVQFCVLCLTGTE
jgi:hypothetical protein